PQLPSPLSPSPAAPTGRTCLPRRLRSTTRTCIGIRCSSSASADSRGQQGRRKGEGDRGEGEELSQGTGNRKEEETVLAFSRVLLARPTSASPATTRSNSASV